MKIYSDVCEAVIIKSFYYKGYTWTWSEDDAVYWRDDVDNTYLDAMPWGAVEVEED